LTSAHTKTPRSLDRPMPKTQDYTWYIYRLRGTPAAFVGMVEATDEQTAIQKAIEEVKITDKKQQERLVAQRRR
jgi:hypothetical protein